MISLTGNKIYYYPEKAELSSKQGKSTIIISLSIIKVWNLKLLE